MHAEVARWRIIWNAAVRTSGDRRTSFGKRVPERAEAPQVGALGGR